MAAATNQLTIILERDDGEFWGRIETPEFLQTTSGDTVEEVTANLRDLVDDYLQNEGRYIAKWSDVKIEDITFTYEYDLTALFDVFNSIKIGAIASLAGLNQSLMRQYATGKKNPSEYQVRKIQDAIRELGERLSKISVA